MLQRMGSLTGVSVIVIGLKMVAGATNDRKIVNNVAWPRLIDESCIISIHKPLDLGG